MKIFDNGVDKVVAVDKECAERYWEQTTGESARDYDFEWVERDPDTIICAWLDHDDSAPAPLEYLKKVGSESNLYCATVTQWLDEMEKVGFQGFWISEEW